MKMGIDGSELERRQAIQGMDWERQKRKWMRD